MPDTRQTRARFWGNLVSKFKEPLFRNDLGTCWLPHLDRTLMMSAGASDNYTMLCHNPSAPIFLSRAGFGPIPAQISSHLDPLGANWAELGKLWSNSALIWSTSINVGRFRPRFGRGQLRFGRFGRKRSKSAEIGHTWPNITTGVLSHHVGRVGPTLAVSTPWETATHLVTKALQRH